jgi:hypothetical protein
MVMVKNLQSDRSAPIPFRDAYPHPQLLAPRNYVATYDGPQSLANACYTSTEDYADKDPLRGAAKDLCYAQPTNGFASTTLDTTTNLDVELPPNGVQYITYTSQEFPDSLPASATSLWVTDTLTRDSQSGAVSTIFKQVPTGALVQTDGDPGSSPTG